MIDKEIRIRCVEMAERLLARSHNANINDILAISDKIYYHILTGNSPASEISEEKVHTESILDEPSSLLKTPSKRRTR